MHVYRNNNITISNFATGCLTCGFVVDGSVVITTRSHSVYNYEIVRAAFVFFPLYQLFKIVISTNSP